MNTERAGQVPHGRVILCPFCGCSVLGSYKGKKLAAPFEFSYKTSVRYLVGVQINVVYLLGNSKFLCAAGAGQNLVEWSISSGTAYAKASMPSYSSMRATI